MNNLKETKKVQAKDLFDEDSVRSLIGDDILQNLVQQTKKGMLLVNHKDIESDNTSFNADIGDSLHNYFFIGNFSLVNLLEFMTFYLPL